MERDQSSSTALSGLIEFLGNLLQHLHVCLPPIPYIPYKYIVFHACADVCDDGWRSRDAESKSGVSDVKLEAGRALSAADLTAWERVRSCSYTCTLHGDRPILV